MQPFFFLPLRSTVSVWDYYSSTGDEATVLLCGLPRWWGEIAIFDFAFRLINGDPQ